MLECIKQLVKNTLDCAALGRPSAAGVRRPVNGDSHLLLPHMPHAGPEPLTLCFAGMNQAIGEEYIRLHSTGAPLCCWRTAASEWRQSLVTSTHAQRRT